MLTIEGISKQFGGLVALQGVSFEVKKGEILSLIGPNGAGKSTLLNCISGFDKPTYGSVHFKKQDITNKEAHHLNRLGIGRTFQIARTFNKMSVLENVTVGYFSRFKTNSIQGILQLGKAKRELEHAREISYDLLRFVGIDDDADVLTSNLPYGKIRLVEIARALAGDPEILLLDEPACGLHPSEVQRFMEILRKMQADGRTILMVEHDMRLVMNVSDRLVVLNNGALLASGVPEEIKKNKEVISAYLGKGFADAIH